MKESRAPWAVGIDYGTSSSLACVAGPDHPMGVVPIPQKPDGPVLDHLPGYLYCPAAGRVIVGEVARRFFTLKPHKVVRSVKRDLAGSWTVGRSTYSAGDLVRFVLREVLAAARAEMPQPVRSVVLTVPSTYGQNERSTLVTAARGASRWLGEVTLLDEPLAAFLAYLDESRRGLGPPAPPRGSVLVFDMGGGTTDISVIEIDSAGDAFRARVLGVWSDARLGGDDFDTALAGQLASEWMGLCPRDRGPLTESERRHAGGKMVAAAEQAKIELGAGPGPVTIRVTRLPGGPDIEAGLDDASYRSAADALLGRVQEALRSGLERAGMGRGDPDVVVMAGGMAHTRIVRKEVEAFFGRPSVVLDDPLTAVVRGACLHHMSLVGATPPVLIEPLRPVLGRTLSIRLAGGRFLPLLSAGTELPAERTLHGCLLTPHTGCAAVRVPLYTEGEAAGRRLLATLTVGSDRPLPGGQPVGIEIAADTNKLMRVRAFLEDGSPRARLLEVTGL